MAVPIVILIIFTILGIFFYASYEISSAIYVKAFCKKKTNEKIVALTFDDGPHPKNSERVLNVLKKHNAEAAFFCIGQNVKQFPEVVELMIKDGHLVGNHSLNHENKFPILSKNKMVKEIQETDALISEITGHKVIFFRPPFGVTNPTIKKALAETGHYVIGWSIRSFDTTTTDTEKVVKRICKKIKAGDVILMHDRLDNAAEVLEQVIQYLEQNEFKIKRVDKMFNLI